MTLPDICPRDGASHCKKNACHLYVVDWRSGDEQCIIGYRSTHKNLSKSAPVVDSYAQDTRRRFGNKNNQEPLGLYPKEKQMTEVRQVTNVQKNSGHVELYDRRMQKEEVRQLVDTPKIQEVAPVLAEEAKPRYWAEVPSVRSLKEPGAGARDEVRSWQRPDTRSGSAQQEISELREEVTVINTKNTTVIESREASQEQPSKKRKSLDDVMNLGLPENYEEEFWK